MGSSGLVRPQLLYTDVLLKLTLPKVFIGIFMADLVKLPMSFTCPSKQCVTYTLAMTVAYFNLFVICAQLAALTEIVYQVQSCPSRVLADRTLGHILRKSISQLISLRQEGKRVKAMGAETQSTERGEVRHMTETTRDLVLADINLAEPRDENRNRRRRTRTTSGNGTITNKSRHHRSITLGDLAAVVQYDSQGGARNPFSGTRNPFSDSEKVHRLEDHPADLYGMIPTARRVAALKTGQPKTPPNFSRPTSPYSTHSYNSGLRAISPAQPESFIMPYTPMSILQSPDSRYSTYSRWSADVTPTSRHSKIGMEGSPDSLVGETVKTPTG